ncbi:hypothetical protein CR513_27040, partial [Mucuna pruriens]
MSIIFNVKALSIEKEGQREASLHKSERNDRHERNERHEMDGRKRRAREEPRTEKLDSMMCKIPLFLGDCKPDSYLN